jgi:GNAT superfamily N-acetyltransferase
MHQGRQHPPAGIVFRRLHTGVERELARSLLQAGGPSWHAVGQTGEWAWFGLWDLAPTEGTGLVGAAATRPVAPRTVELCALAVPAAAPWRGLGDRLLREVADTLRADGDGQIVAGQRPPTAKGWQCCAAPGLGPQALSARTLLSSCQRSRIVRPSGCG